MNKSELQSVELLKNSRETLTTEIRKVIVGLDTVIEEILITLFSRGHCLLIGVPGLAKTLLIKSLSQVLDLKFSRIQFTPDLMPSDITGTDIIEEDPQTGKRHFKFVHGPLFANIVLADEINRTPPKTQSALLQAMQEYQVTAGGSTYALDLPFFVLATQNPIEQEGTYPLPEAQLDRFMFSINVPYPSLEQERKIVMTTTSTYDARLTKVMNHRDILELQELIRKVPIGDTVMDYAINLVRASRPKESEFDFVKNWVSWGASPRASQYLVLGGKVRALLYGRYAVSIEDIRSLAQPVLKHRIITNFAAEAEGVSSVEIIEKLLQAGRV